MHILIAPNAFKNSLDASAAADAIEDGFLKSRLSCSCERFPIGDGGDGTGKLIVEKCRGVIVNAEVSDPLGRKIPSSFGLIDNGKTAVIEMAEASGIRLLSQEELNPLYASSFGTGELISHALDEGVTKLVITMGGSATVDGATGILKALGVRFLDAEGIDLKELPAGLIALERADLSGLDRRIMDCEIVVLCDVENTLLGDRGSATVFGPQKGASEKDVPLLEASLRRLRDVALMETGKDMASVVSGGTAGGAAAGLYAFLNARLVNGIDYYLQITEFDRALKNADLVVTGEGSIDEQTLHGKGPFGVARRAKERDMPVIGVAGKIPLESHAGLSKYFDVLLPIGNEPCDIASAMMGTKGNLVRTSEQIGNLLAIK
ncbi:glycerate kinase [Arcticibacter tournemirensis]|uniref:Glycerate kinase n=1 Tax=Arcticibacter tournemirensis TaxID=699437 RepID=A0A4Q0M6W4_9SPHI|nr:glycerate kinase [Arcticibacter tournemirensis]RXF68797.1 glycerate kinase [Arcticibacter tournemirensis]